MYTHMQVHTTITDMHALLEFNVFAHPQILLPAPGQRAGWHADLSGRSPPTPCVSVFVMTEMCFSVWRCVFVYLCSVPCLGQGWEAFSPSSHPPLSPPFLIYVWDLCPGCSHSLPDPAYVLCVCMFLDKLCWIENIIVLAHWLKDNKNFY